jgi:hypothetical protein
VVVAAKNMVSVLCLGLLCGVGASSIARAAGGSSPCGILAQNSASGKRAFQFSVL